MTTLMPEAPGHWTEAVLLAFPEAVLTNDAPVPGTMHVTLALEDDLEIEFRKDMFTLPDAPESYSANLQDYDEDSNLVSETLLVESSDIDLLLDAMDQWVDRYFTALAEIDAMLGAS